LPKTDEMHSDDWVTIYQPQTANKIVGKGMKGHPKLNEFTLLSQVRSYYEQLPDTDN
jgi:lipopolysaccharide export system protein LptC